MKTNLRIGFQFCRYRLIPEQSGGLETSLEGERKVPLKRNRKPKDGEPMVPHPLGTRLPSSSGLLCTADRVEMYELRTAGASRAALPFVLGLRCEREVYGTTASQVPVLCSLGAQCGSMTCFCGARLRAWFGLPCCSKKFVVSFPI